MYAIRAAAHPSARAALLSHSRQPLLRRNVASRQQRWLSGASEARPGSGDNTASTSSQTQGQSEGAVEEPASVPEGEGSKVSLEDLKARLQTKEAEVVELTGRLRYAQADYQNLQRIAAKEKEQTRDYAITRFATDLLETVDVLSLALRSVPEQYKSPAGEGVEETAVESKPAATVLRELVEGVSLTNKQLVSTLGKYGVTAYDPVGERFDPNVHEALYAAPVPGREPGEVIETQKVGYMIKGRVLRAPQVGIVQEKA